MYHLYKFIYMFTHKLPIEHTLLCINKRMLFFQSLANMRTFLSGLSLCAVIKVFGQCFRTLCPC